MAGRRRALGNLLNATHQLGFGAIVLSGERCFDPLLGAELGIKPDEFLAGFVTMGSVVEAPPPRNHALPGQVWSAWVPPASLASLASPSSSTAAPRQPADPSNLDIADDNTHKTCRT